MSILSRPFIADTIARIFASAIRPVPKVGVRFPEINCRTTTVKIPTRHGLVPATVYEPPAHLKAPSASAVYVNVHGGGFVVGHPEQDDPWCRYLATHAGVVVINPDYVLAPRYRFPAAAEQVYDIACYAADSAREWDGSRLCVGGQSAGGNLSAAVSRLALNDGGPVISLQVLHYAPLDLVTPTSLKPSPVGNRAIMKPWMGEVFDTAYIPDAARRRDPLASPAWGENAVGLDGIAPALVIAAEHDRLRGEARRYATALDGVGSLVEYYEVPGVDHGYNIMSNSLEATRRTYDRIVTHVRSATAGS